jgi:pantothenate synthetase
MSIFRSRKPRHPDPVKVAYANNQSEAEMIENMLNDEGIPCMIQRVRGFDVPDFLAAGPRNVIVPAAAEEKARKILADLESEGATLAAESRDRGRHDDPRFDAPDFPG